MYRHLATAVANLSRALQHVSNELQLLANGAGATSQQSGTGCTSSPTAHTSSPSHSPPPSRAEVQKLCEWVRDAGLNAWLSPPAASATTAAAAAAAVGAHHWLSWTWCPPASESAFHSLSYGAKGSSASAVLSDMEKTLTNSAARRIGLPTRFQWPADKTEGGAPTQSSSSNSKSSNVGTMLWPTAMRTTSGNLAPHAQTPSCAAASVAGSRLPSLPLVATAGQVFAPAPRATRPTASGVCSPPLTAPSSCEGGGILCSTRLEAYVTLLLTARTQALTRRSGQQNIYGGQEAAARVEGSLVLYASDQADALLLRAAQLLGIRHVRVLQTVAGGRTLPSPSPPPSLALSSEVPEKTVRHHNYVVDVARLQARVLEDVAAGLYPVMVVGTFGSALSGAVDPVAAMGDLCRKLGVWYHLDASHGGAALLATSVSAASSRLSAFAAEFEAAAHTADSVLCSAGCTALPYSVLPHADCSAAVLFAAHVRKVAWSVQQLGESRQSTFNQYLTPRVADSEVLHLSPLAHSCRFVANHAAAEVSSTTAAGIKSASDEKRSSFRTTTSSCLLSDAATVTAQRACAVARHQRFTAAVLEAVRRDGRFDAALDASLFGLVHLRWLTAADEATQELAVELSKMVERGGEEASGTSLLFSRPPPVKVHVGVVQLQRRVWVVLSFGKLPHAVDGVESAGDAPWREQEAFVLAALDAAARRVLLPGH